MNQILYTDDKKNKRRSGNKGPLEINTVLIVFAISCILFGIILAGKAIYNMIENNQNDNSNVPLVKVTQDSDKLLLEIKHDKIIDKIIYNWNSEQDITLYGRGRTEIEEEIMLPVWINSLNLKVIDIDGKNIIYTKDYELKDGDVTKPQIELLLDGSKLKIVAKDETALDYIEYYWNNEDATTSKAREDSIKIIEEKIDILKGENTLTVVAVDIAGNESIKEQTYKGAKKPLIEITREGDQAKVVVSDEEGISKIDYTLNGKEFSTDSKNEGKVLNVKNAEFRLNLIDGTNNISVTVYNLSELKTQQSMEITK